MNEAPYSAEAFSPTPGRCFRPVSRQDDQAGPIRCPEPPRWQGTFRAKDGHRYTVQACDGHGGPLEHAPPLGNARTGTPTGS
jgi:hypothetical protein